MNLLTLPRRRIEQSDDPASVLAARSVPSRIPDQSVPWHDQKTDSLAISGGRDAPPCNVASASAVPSAGGARLHDGAFPQSANTDSGSRSGCRPSLTPPSKFGSSCVLLAGRDEVAPQLCRP